MRVTRESVVGLLDAQLEDAMDLIMNEIRRRAKIKAPILPKLNFDEQNLVKTGDRVLAIRQYRDRVGCNLTDAREVVELFSQQQVV